MKIGIVTLQLRNLGGQYQIIHLAQELIKLNHPVVIYTLNDKVLDFDEVSLKGLTIKSCKVDNKIQENKSSLLGFLYYLYYLFKSTLLMVKLLKDEDLDLLNPHDWTMHWACVLVKFKRKIPIVWMCNDVWHIPGNEEVKENRLVFRIGGKFIIGFIDILFTLFVDKIVVLSFMAKKIVEKYYFKKPLVVRTGIDLSLFKKLPSKVSARKRLNIDNNSFIFLCMQAFFYHRRFEDAINAFEKLIRTNNYKTKMIIAGSDVFMKSYSEKIQNIVKQNNLQDRILVKTNYMEKKVLIDYLAACDVYLFPNEKYMWGLLAVEAMACGQPCIVSSGAAINEIIENGKNGFIFKVRDVNDLENKMEKLLSNPALCKVMGNNAKKYVFENLSWEKYSKEMLKIFESVRNGKGV